MRSCQEAWIERYEHHRVEDYSFPDGKQAREAYAIVIGKDGTKLLDALYADTAPVFLREMPAIRLHQGLGLFGRHLERKQAGEGLPQPLQT